MRIILCGVFFLFYFLLLLAGAGICKLPPIASREKFQEDVEIKVQETLDERVEKHFYKDNLLVEKIFLKNGKSQSKEQKVTWKDCGTRWECLRYKGEIECERILIYKRGLNQSGNLAGKKLDDIFGNEFLFDKGWDFGDRKVRARIIGENHFLQILVLSSANGVILQEILLSDPEFDIDKIEFVQDVASRKKLLIFMRNSTGNCAGGNLYLADLDNGAVECLGSRKIKDVHLSPSRSYLLVSDWGDGTGEGVTLYDLKQNKSLYSRFFGGSYVREFQWSEKELYALLVIATKDGRMRLIRVSTVSGKAGEHCENSLAISPSPSGSKAVILRRNADSQQILPDGINVANALISFKDTDGKIQEREFESVKDFSLMVLVDLNRDKEQILTDSFFPDMDNAQWSGREDFFTFFDYNAIYRVETGRKSPRKRKVSGPIEPALRLPARSLLCLGGDQYFVLQNGILYYLKGTNQTETVAKSLDSYAISDKNKLIACLSRKNNKFNLYIYNLKSREQIPLIQGRDRIESFDWETGTVFVLKVVLSTSLVTQGEPVVLNFNEVGEIVPLK